MGDLGEKVGKIAKKGLVGLVLLGALGGCCALGYNFLPDSIEVEVTGTEVKRYNGRDLYLVYTMDEEGKPHVFKNKDTLWRIIMGGGIWNSSDIQAEAKAYEDLDITVEIRKYGWRFRPRSMYENIIEIERLEE